MSQAEPKKQCFVLSPIGDDKSPTREAADKVLRHLIKKALGSEFDVDRADADTNPGAITPRMVSSILNADLIVADLSGLNANVFYEVAMAHGFRKPTVHIQRVGEELPFDIKDMRTVKYDITDPDELERSQKTLREYAASALKDPENLVTPLSSAQRFASVQQSNDPVAQSNVQVLEALSALRDEVRGLRRPSASQAIQEQRRFSEAQRSLLMEQANTESLMAIVRSVLKDGRLKAEDLRHAITGMTSIEFDEFLREQLYRLTGTGDLQELNEVLFHPEVAAFVEENEAEEEPPF
ncbi:MAG TPA: hypothetical protein VG318_00130 [Actinomycetota bacterium]|nr:hypothetical protein [Actinomycetota bacterium]